jgi:hypothetical protein
MMNKLLVIGIIAVLIIGGLYFLVPNVRGEETQIDGEMTVTISEMGSLVNDVAATVDIGDPSISEQMMMSIGGDIRQEDFKPLADFNQDVGKLKGASYYSIKCSSTFTVSGNNIASITNSAITFRGYIAFTSTGGSGSHYMLKSTTKTDTVSTITSAITFGTAKTVTSDAFSYKLDGLDSTTVSKITGKDLTGGTTIVFDVLVNAVDHNGNNVKVQKSGTLLVTASLMDAGSMSIAISSMSSSVTALSMMNIDAMLDQMDMAKAEA